MRRDGTVWFVLVAATLRLPGLWTDFWLDEIWALDNVGRLESPLGVFTGIHHDSNHWLISLWMYAVGPSAAFWIYRLPSFVAGLLAVPIGGRLAARIGVSPSLAMLLLAVSFPLGFYASEARGYALASTAALAALWALSRWLEGASGRALTLASCAMAVGLLGHLSFLAVLVAVAVFLVLGAPARFGLRRSLIPLLAPVVVLLVLIVVDLRFLQFGGGPALDRGRLLTELGALVIGAPLGRAWTGAAAWLGGAVLVLALGQRLRVSLNVDRSPGRLATVGFLVTVTLLPVLIALAVRPPFLFPRYFLVGLTFVPLVLAAALGHVPIPARRLGVAVLIAFNLLSWEAFWREGRGQYAASVSAILRAAPAGPVTVASDHDFRNRLIVDFYRQRLGADGARLTYVTGEAAFLIVSDPAGLERGRCADCRILVEYGASPLSGARWRVYGRSGAGVAGAVPSGVK